MWETWAWWKTWVEWFTLLLVEGQSERCELQFAQGRDVSAHEANPKSARSGLPYQALARAGNASVALADDSICVSMEMVRVPAPGGAENLV